MKSNQKLKQEARIANAIATKDYKVLGGVNNPMSGYFKFKDAYLNAVKQKNITTASIREEFGREKINPRKIIRCSDCGEKVPSFFSHIDQNCLAQ